LKKIFKRFWKTFAVLYLMIGRIQYKLAIDRMVVACMGATLL